MKVKNKSINKKVTFDIFREVINYDVIIKEIRFEIFNDIIPINNDNNNNWLKENDYEDSLLSAKKELTDLLKNNSSMTINDAKRLLYQPNNMIYDSNNFNL